jgi:hypothetical protein
MVFIPPVYIPWQEICSGYLLAQYLTLYVWKFKQVKMKDRWFRDFLSKFAVTKAGILDWQKKWSRGSIAETSEARRTGLIGILATQSEWKLYGDKGIVMVAEKDGFHE